MRVTTCAAVLAACVLGCGGKRSEQRQEQAPAEAPPNEEARGELDAAGDPPFEVTELAPDVLAVTTEPFAANSLLVRTESGAVILVDTPTTPADTATLVNWVTERWGRAPDFAINSHWHGDAAGGNQVLLERGVEVISTEQTGRLVAAGGERLRDELIELFARRDPETARELEAMRPMPASRQVKVDGRLALELGGENVELIYPGPSHSADSIGVFFPARKLLYGGCIVRSDGRIINKSEADAEGWPRALQAFARLDPTIVIPGHGKRFDAAMIEESLPAARALARDR